MSYTLDQFAAECRDALAADNSPAGREKVRQCVEKALADAEFVATHFPPDNTDGRKILYEDPDFGFCILAHVYEGAKSSNPHDHGPAWAIYGQAVGVTEMTEYKLLQAPADGNPGKVAPVETYAMNPGTAKLYEIGKLHAPERKATTKLIRIEGQDMTKVKRDKFEVAA